MKCIITGDETWAYEFDVEVSQKSSQWRFKDEPEKQNAMR